MSVNDPQAHSVRPAIDLRHPLGPAQYDECRARPTPTSPCCSIAMGPKDLVVQASPCSPRSPTSLPNTNPRLPERVCSTVPDFANCSPRPVQLPALLGSSWVPRRGPCARSSSTKAPVPIGDLAGIRIELSPCATAWTYPATVPGRSSAAFTMSRRHGPCWRICARFAFISMLCRLTMRPCWSCPGPIAWGSFPNERLAMSSHVWDAVPASRRRATSGHNATLILHASAPSESGNHRRVLQLDYAAVDLPSELDWHGL